MYVVCLLGGLDDTKAIRYVHMSTDPNGFDPKDMCTTVSIGYLT